MIAYVACNFYDSNYFIVFLFYSESLARDFDFKCIFFLLRLNKKLSENRAN